MNRTTILLAAGIATLVFLAVLFMPDLNLSRVAAGDKSSKTDAEIALDAGTLDTETARDVLALKRAGIHLALADLDSARNDAPENRIYGAVAEIANPAFEALNPRDADHKPHQAVCFAIRRNNGVAHEIVYYNADNLYQMGGAGLYGWIRSGCAAAVHTSRQTLSETSYMVKILALVPKDEIHANIRSSISGNLYMACGEESRQHLKGLSEARRAGMEARENERCRKLSGI